MYFVTIPVVETCCLAFSTQSQSHVFKIELYTVVSGQYWKRG